MLNDPMVQEASRVLAVDLMRETKDPEATISKAFARVLSRPPSAKEMEYLINYYNAELNYFSSQNGLAADLLQVGEYPLNKEDITPEHAAMMQVVVSLYNLEETLTKI
jgi:hypothetical protein